MPTFFVQALTLRRWGNGEHNRTYRVLTAEHGMIDVRAQGAAKITSKLAGHLEPFGQVKLMLARRRGPYRVAGVQLIRRFNTDDLITNQRLAKLAAIAEQLLGGEQPQPQAYHMVNEGWQELCQSRANDQLLTLTHILLKLCQAAGYALPAAVLNTTPESKLSYVVEEHLAAVLPYPVRLR